MESAANTNMPLALQKPSSASLRMMFHPITVVRRDPRLQTLRHCTMPPLDAQWLCLRYADFNEWVTLTCAWSEWLPSRPGGPERPNPEEVHPTAMYLHKQCRLPASHSGLPAQVWLP